MDRKKIEEVVDFLEKTLSDNGIEADKIIIFGSQLHERATEESDLDLAVVSKTFQGKGIFERVELIGDVQWKVIKKFVIPLDIIMMTPEEWENGHSLASQFARNGEIVFSKS